MLVQRPCLIAFDGDWQFPAITEQHAFHKISSLSQLPESVTYVAYPWATLIDKLQSSAADAKDHSQTFDEFCKVIPTEGLKITVCQHILAKKYSHLFRKAGISTVFWAHSSKEDFHPSSFGDLQFKPFPLYPVQLKKSQYECCELFGMDAIARPYLFSFIGARANRWYLTSTRNLLFELLSGDPRGVIVPRDRWHYQSIVYDQQIHRRTLDSLGSNATTEAGAAEFSTVLSKSIFSLCPSGTGPNSIRLWESIGDGAIPVILADTYAPPGNQALWKMAAVFCGETESEIKELPDRLAKIAADPERLAEMRHAMRQLWMMYGPDAFVSDVLEFMLDFTAERRAGMEDFEPFADWVLAQRSEGVAQHRLLLIGCASELLLDPVRAIYYLDLNLPLGEVLAEARESLPDNDPLSTHFDKVLALARSSVVVENAPAISRQLAPKVCLFGRHSKRTPLSYAGFRREIGERLAWAANPADADLIVTGLDIDLKENGDVLATVLRASPLVKVAVISEEPLWDTTWSDNFTSRSASLRRGDSELSYRVLNHETSNIFAFRKIPYFLLTNSNYPIRYQQLLSTQIKQSSQDLLDAWMRANVRAAFFAEYRKGENYSQRFPECDMAALSSYRTEVAELSKAPGVLISGKGWGSDARRQDLPDWHLDKLARLKNRARVISAYENTHQQNYITEKIFDAFALGGIPTYWASPQHRVWEFVSTDAILNTYDDTPAGAARKIAEFEPSLAFAEAYQSVQRSLFDLFSDLRAIGEERKRVVECVLSEIHDLV